VQLFGRRAPPARPPTWSRVNADHRVSFALGEYADYEQVPRAVRRPARAFITLGWGANACRAQSGKSFVRPCMVYSNVGTDAGVMSVRLRGPGEGDTEQVYFEDALPLFDGDNSVANHRCGEWHRSDAIVCSQQSHCTVEVLQQVAQLRLHQFTLEVSALGLKESHHRQAVGRASVDVRFEGPLGAEHMVVNVQRGFGVSMASFGQFLRPPIGIFSREVSYAEAELECEEFGGTLASIHTDEELEYLAAQIELSGVTERPVFIGAALNASTKVWKWLDHTPYDERYMSSRNFMAFGASNIMSIVVYPAWQEVYGHPGRLEDEAHQPFACTRTQQKGVMFARGCAVFSERSDGPRDPVKGFGDITFRIEDTVERLHFEDSYESTGPTRDTRGPRGKTGSGLVQHVCGGWHDVTGFHCGATFGTSCEVAVSHTGSNAYATVYGYTLEYGIVSVESADGDVRKETVHTNMQFSGRFDVPFVSPSPYEGGWERISAAAGFGFDAAPTYQLYGTHAAADQAVRACLTFSDNARNGGLEVCRASERC
jgi:hypothetical protein